MSAREADTIPHFRFHRPSRSLCRRVLELKSGGRFPTHFTYLSISPFRRSASMLPRTSSSRFENTLWILR